MNRKYSVIALTTVAFLAGIFFATSGANFFGRSELTGMRTDAAVRNANTTPELPQTPGFRPPATERNTFSDDFIAVAESVNPAVVQIHSERIVVNQNAFSGSPLEQFFRQPGGNSESRRTSALGSGVIIREDGFIVTNNHVIDGSDNLTVTLLDGREFDAEIVGTDAASDLAIIRVKESALPTISLYNTATVRVGEWVLAFGSPLSDDLGNTVTSGIVSAVGRNSQRLSSLNLYASFIQTDAAINPGNSGGPLVNLDGQLVGINSAIYSRSGGSQGIGFTIPADVVQNVALQLIETGAVSRGGLGVRFSDVSRSLANVLNVPHGSAQVTDVVANSVAERAGIKEGDIIIAIDGKLLHNSNELRTTVGNRLPGDRLLFSIVRNGEEREIEVTLGDLSRYNVQPAADVEIPEKREEEPDAEELGFSIGTLSNRLKEQLNLSDDVEKGVIILTIDRGSAAFRDADLQRGDIIISVNGESVGTPEEFIDAYHGVPSGKSFLIRVARVAGGAIQKFYTALSKPE